MLVIVVYIMIAGGTQDTAIAKLFELEKQIFIESGAHAEQSLRNIKVVKAFGQEQKECNKFVTHLDRGTKTIMSHSFMYSIGFGLHEGVPYFVNGFGNLIGGVFIYNKVSNLFVV